MILQERDIEVLTYLARYFILNSHQIRELSFPDDSTGRICRRRLTKMKHEGYLKKRQLQVVNPKDGSTSPVYHLTKQGLEWLSAHYDDERLLLKPLEPNQPTHLHHYVAVSESYRLFDRAIKVHAPDVQIPKWFHEEEVINPDETDKSKFQRLRRHFEGSKRTGCFPDAGFLIDYKDHKAVVYLEQDRDSYFHNRVAARKAPGYKEFYNRQIHKEQFPETKLPFFYVLFLVPTAKRAQQLRKAFIKETEGHESQRLYRFGSLETLTEYNLFFDPQLTCCHHDDKVPLIKQIE